MALYKLDGETGEAIRVIDVEEWGAWRGGMSDKDLVIARTDIIEQRVSFKKIVSAVDVLKCPYHDGQVILTVVTKLVPNQRDENRHAWEIGIVGEDPKYNMTTSTRKQALEAHRSLVNAQLKAHGGRVLR